MTYENFELLNITSESGIAVVTIDHPPINLFDLELISEMDRAGRELETDDDVRVVVVESANPDFFIAHADVGFIQTLPEEPPDKPTELNFFQQMVDRFRTMPKATIAKIEGIARGGGSELVLSMDMRFAAIGQAVLSQPEVALGIIPGGGGTQRLPRLMGHGRALEVVLGCGDFDAETAEHYGYINRALAPEEIDSFVFGLARRIASFPAHAIAAAKLSVSAAATDPLAGLLEESDAFNHAVAHPAARRRMQEFLDKGGQTAEIERANLADLFRRLT